MTILGIIVGILVLTVLIVLHEYGHYRTAIRNGVRVLEFAIGFGPKVAAWVKNPKYLEWQKTKKGDQPKKWLRLAKKDYGRPQDTLIFSINWLPLGGFCAMDGESDADTRKGTFGATSFWAKTKILFAGVAMNWLTAFVILTVLAWTGMPVFLENQFKIDSDFHPEYGVVTVTEVIKDTPAAEAGLRSGDRLISASSNANTPCDESPCPTAETVNFGTANDVVTFNNNHLGQTVIYTVERENCDTERTSNICPLVSQTKELSVTLNPEGSEYTLGIRMSQEGQTLYRSTWSAPIVGAGTTVQITVETYKGIAGMVGNLVSGVARQFSPDDATREAGRTAIGTAGDSVSGPIGIIGVIFPAFTSAGVTNLAFLAALISISLACMNVLPIPALDGGRWLLIALSRLRGKRLSKEMEEKIVSRAFIVLLALFFLIAVLDIIRLF